MKSTHTTDCRMTPQRRAVLKVLKNSHDHPDASEVHTRVKTELPGISLATIYNCLDTLVQHNYIRQVNLDRQPTRFCANLHDHAHFYCDRCGCVNDANPSPGTDTIAMWSIPTGAALHHIDTTLRGLCSDCATATHRQSLA